MKKATLGAFLDKDEICSFKLKNAVKMHKSAEECRRVQEDAHECSESAVKMHKSAHECSESATKVQFREFAPMPLFKKSGGGG